MKPDQLIKRRGKLGLIKVNVNLQEAKKWIDERMGKNIQVSVCSTVPILGKSFVTNCLSLPFYTGNDKLFGNLLSDSDIFHCGPLHFTCIALRSDQDQIFA